MFLWPFGTQFSNFKNEVAEQMKHAAMAYCNGWEKFTDKKAVILKMNKMWYLYNHSQNTLRLIYKTEKCKFLMPSLMADFLHFSSIIAIFYFSKGDWALICTQFWGFFEIFLFPKILSVMLWVISYIQFLVTII